MLLQLSPIFSVDLFQTHVISIISFCGVQDSSSRLEVVLLYKRIVMSKYAADIIVVRYVIGNTLKCVRARELITVATGSSHTPPSNNTQFFLSLLLCRLNAIAIHVHFVSIWKSPSLLIFFSSSISISTVSYWYCAEFYCPFLHLVTSTTG